MCQSRPQTLWSATPVGVLLWNSAFQTQSRALYGLILPTRALAAEFYTLGPPRGKLRRVPYTLELGMATESRIVPPVYPDSYDLHSTYTGTRNIAITNMVSVLGGHARLQC